MIAYRSRSAEDCQGVKGVKFGRRRQVKKLGPVYSSIDESVSSPQVESTGDVQDVGVPSATKPASTLPGASASPPAFGASLGNQAPIPYFGKISRNGWVPSPIMPFGSWPQHPGLRMRFDKVRRSIRSQKTLGGHLVS